MADCEVFKAEERNERLSLMHRILKNRRLHTELAKSDHISAIQDSLENLKEAEKLLVSGDMSTALELIVLAEEQLACTDREP